MLDPAIPGNRPSTWQCNAQAAELNSPSPAGRHREPPERTPFGVEVHMSDPSLNHDTALTYEFNSYIVFLCEERFHLR